MSQRVVPATRDRDEADVTTTARRPQQDEPTAPHVAIQPEPEPMAATETAATITISRTLAASLLTALVAAVLGTGVGVAKSAAQEPATPAPTRVELAASLTEAKAYTDTQAGRLRDERKAEQAAGAALLAEQWRSITTQLGRMDTKLDQVGLDMGSLKIEVATIKARGRDNRR
jgi:hypothetical protein